MARPELMTHAASAAVDLEASKVAEGVYRIVLPLSGHPLRSVNSYLLRADKGYVLVDCGWDSADVRDTLFASLQRFGVGLEMLHTLVVTHHHADHYGLAAALLARSPIALLMHGQDWLAAQSAFLDPLVAERSKLAWLQRNGWKAAGTNNGLAESAGEALDARRPVTLAAPTSQLEHGSFLSENARSWLVLWTPGHTPGHICLYNQERRILISGDHVLDPISPHVGVTRPGTNNPLGAFLRSLRQIAKLDVDTVLPAHGEPFAGLSRRVDELMAHHRKRVEAILVALRGGPATAVQVSESLRWTRRDSNFRDLPQLHRRMAVAETIAHLDNLRERGEVSCETRDDVIYYARITG